MPSDHSTETSDQELLQGCITEVGKLLDPSPKGSNPLSYPGPPTPDPPVLSHIPHVPVCSDPAALQPLPKPSSQHTGTEPAAPQTPLGQWGLRFLPFPWWQSRILPPDPVIFCLVHPAQPRDWHLKGLQGPLPPHTLLLPSQGHPGCRGRQWQTVSFWEFSYQTTGHAHHHFCSWEER